MKCGKEEGAGATFVIGKPVKVFFYDSCLNEGKLCFKNQRDKSEKEFIENFVDGRVTGA
jgi:hypothetical protein